MMNISPHNNISFISNQSVQNSKKHTLSFRAHHDKWIDAAKRINLYGDGIIYKEHEIYNYTKLFRGLRFFKELPQLLAEKFSQGCEVYDYACSVGHEALSIVISLFDFFGKDEAKKYLPIKAFDNNPTIIDMANQWKIFLSKQEISYLNTFPNVNSSSFVKKISGSIIDEKEYTVNDNVKKFIKFKESDLFKDLENKNFGDKPCILFFRNAWPYLTKEGRTKLVKLLSDNLTSGSIVVIGHFDKMHCRGLVSEFLDNDFKRIMKTYKTGYKEYPDEFQDIENNSVSAYCFEKK